MEQSFLGAFINLIGTGVIVGVAGFLLWDKIGGITDSIKELYKRTDDHETRISCNETICEERHGGGK
jgi:hypothetical protein